MVGVSLGVRQSGDAHTPPKCHVSLALEKAVEQQPKQQFNITASAVSAPRDPLNGLLQAVSFLGEFCMQLCIDVAKTLKC